MMTSNMPQGQTEKEHRKFVMAFEKTYRNKVLRVAWQKDEFKAVYRGNDKRPLGLHSKRKMGATTAKRRGAPVDCVDHQGRWVPKKGSRIVTGTYIDPEDMYADAMVAAKLALGGPIKYKLKEDVAAAITDAWLAANVVPNIGRRFEHDSRLVRNLGLALL